MTSTPPNAPTTSWRRRTPANRSKAAAMRPAGKPRRNRTIATPAAFAALWMPGRGNRKSKASFPRYIRNAVIPPDSPVPRTDQHSLPGRVPGAGTAPDAEGFPFVE